MGERVRATQVEPGLSIKHQGRRYTIRDILKRETRSGNVSVVYVTVTDDAGAQRTLVLHENTASFGDVGYQVVNVGKPAFADLPGLPARDDAEVAELMEAVGRLTRTEVDECVRSLCRAALGWRRSGDPTYLTALAEDAVFAMRLRRDPDVDRALRDASRRGPSAAGVDVDGLLAELEL